jgi:hypothetical protein
MKQMLVFLEPNGLTKRGKAKWEKTFPNLPEYGKHGIKMNYTDVPPAYNFGMTIEDFKDYWRHEEFIRNFHSWKFAFQMFTGIPGNQIETLLKDDEYEKSGMELLLSNLFERLRDIESKIKNIDDDLYDVKNKLPQDEW